MYFTINQEWYQTQRRNALIESGQQEDAKKRIPALDPKANIDQQSDPHTH